MPYIRGVRNYSFYNDEDTDHDFSVDELQAIRLAQVPAYKPAPTLAPIVEALKNLGKDTVRGADVRESEDTSDEEPQQFFAGDDLQLSDMTVTVDDVGVLQFPVEEDVIDKLISVSKEVDTNCPEEELEDTSARPCHVISASQIKVDFKEEALIRIFEVVSGAMNIRGKLSVKPNTSCLSIFGPGQLCGWQRVTQTADVLLEVVLPSHCVGGGRVIKHGTQTHSCSLDANRWTAFYSDCARRVCGVEEGHRLLLTLDLELEYLCGTEPWRGQVVDVSLNNAVAQHFRREDRLLVFLLHKYSEDTLAWHTIKGRDVTYTRALMSVAESQDLRVSLALGECQETWETSGYHGPVRNSGSVELHWQMDDAGRRQDERVTVDYETMAKQVCTFRPEFWALGEPDREVPLGWYGEGPALREQWYRRACVVLDKK